MTLFQWYSVFDRLQWKAWICVHVIHKLVVAISPISIRYGSHSHPPRNENGVLDFTQFAQNEIYYSIQLQYEIEWECQLPELRKWINLAYITIYVCRITFSLFNLPCYDFIIFDCKARILHLSATWFVDTITCDSVYSTKEFNFSYCTGWFVLLAKKRKFAACILYIQLVVYHIATLHLLYPLYLLFFIMYFGKDKQGEVTRLVFIVNRMQLQLPHEIAWKKKWYRKSLPFM